jgi:hypothetical protein
MDDRYKRGDGKIYDFALRTSRREGRTMSPASGASNVEIFPPTNLLFLDQAQRHRVRYPPPNELAWYETLYDRAVRRQKEQAEMIKRSRLGPPKK